MLTEGIEVKKYENQRSQSFEFQPLPEAAEQVSGDEVVLLFVVLQDHFRP